jgi:hypothetical protein
VTLLIGIGLGGTADGDGEDLVEGAVAEGVREWLQEGKIRYAAPAPVGGV